MPVGRESVRIRPSNLCPWAWLQPRAVGGEPADALASAPDPGAGWATVVVLAGGGQVASPAGVTLLDVEGESGLVAYEGMAAPAFAVAEAAG